jgi:hypothetical protein
MTKRENLLEKARNNPKGLKFNEFQTLLGHQGWVLDRSEGDHFTYKKEGWPGVLTIQPWNNGMAAPYQVKMLLQTIGEEQGREK